MIAIEQLSFNYAEKEILKNISVCFKKGDFCAIIGPNGAGKTTLLKIIARLISVKHTIKLQNREIKHLSIKEMSKLVAYVPQFHDNIFHFSVYDTVMMGRNPYQNRWEANSEIDREIVNASLRLTNLEHLQNRFTNQLSGGEKQRVLIARAIAQQTPILLLDEPLSNLDILHQFEIMDILSQLNNNQNITILIVLHNLSISLQYVKSILMLKDGNVLHHGEISNLLIPQNIKELFNLSDRFSVDFNGNITKK